jgi:hypothetical protein
VVYAVVALGPREVVRLLRVRRRTPPAATAATEQSRSAVPSAS